MRTSNDALLVGTAKMSSGPDSGFVMGVGSGRGRGDITRDAVLYCELGMPFLPCVHCVLCDPVLLGYFGFSAGPVQYS